MKRTFRELLSDSWNPTEPILLYTAKEGDYSAQGVAEALGTTTKDCGKTIYIRKADFGQQKHTLNIDSTSDLSTLIERGGEFSRYHFILIPDSNDDVRDALGTNNLIISYNLHTLVQSLEEGIRAGFTKRLEEMGTNVWPQNMFPDHYGPSY